MIDAHDHDAVGDGVTDCTAALQRALDDAAAREDTVYLPAGIYACGTLRLPPHVALRGDPTWSYQRSGGTLLRLNDPAATCLVDISAAVGGRLDGLELDGANLGEQVHGVFFERPDYNETEDSPHIENCRIANFTGDGIHLKRIFVFYVRASHVIRCGGDGLRVRGWDGFVIDSAFTVNGGAGFAAREENASLTLTHNRIEWNHAGGIVVAGGTHYNITGNYIDRSGGPGIWLYPRGHVDPTVFTITGNVIFRSGRPEWCPPDDPDASAHLRFEGVHGLVCTGNTMNAGRDDRGKGQWSPRRGIVCRRLSSSIIRNNVLHRGAIDQLVDDRGDHGDGVLVDANVGSLFKPGVHPVGVVNAVLADPAWE